MMVMSNMGTLLMGGTMPSDLCGAQALADSANAERSANVMGNFI